MNKTNIPWVKNPDGSQGFTWNPTTGCTGPNGVPCGYCYARKVAARFREGDEGMNADTDATVRENPSEPWVVEYDNEATASVFPAGFHPTLYPHRLAEPLRRKKPAVIFLGSMGDVFDPAIPDEFRNRIFATVAAARQHTFVVLTKRAEAMRRYFAISEHRDGICVFGQVRLTNLVIGVSVTNQNDADELIPLVLDTPAAKRMASVEPMMGPVEFDRHWLGACNCYDLYGTDHPVLDFIAVGGKTPGKPLHDDWFCPRAASHGCHTDECPPCVNFTTEKEPAYWLRSLRDQCLAAGVPFHYKAGSQNPPLDGAVHDAGVPR